MSTDLSRCCAARPAGQASRRPRLFLGALCAIVYSLAAAAPAWAANDLRIEGSSCQADAAASPGYQVKVELWMRDLAQNVSGFQAFLAYDTGHLTYRPDLSSYSVAPFPQHIQSITTAEIAAGALNLDGTVMGGGGGVMADSLLATLYFDVASECSATQVTFRMHGSFVSELSFQGVPVPTTLVDSNPLILDGAAPAFASVYHTGFEAAQGFSATPGRAINGVPMNRSINGQDGWFVEYNGTLEDEEIALDALHGAQAWRISNWYTNGIVVHAASAPVGVPAGESGAMNAAAVLAGSRKFRSEFYWKTASTTPDNSFVQISPDGGAGSRWGGRLDITNFANPVAPFDGRPGVTPAGLQLHWDTITNDTDSYISSPVLSQDTWYHTIITITFVPGLSAGLANDIVEIQTYDPNGTLVWNVPATPGVSTWEAAGYGPPAAVDRLVWRTKWDTAQMVGNGYSLSQPAGFLFDELTISTELKAADVTIQCHQSTDPDDTGTPTVNDNCDAMPTVAYTDVVTAGACPDAQQIARTWTATDDCGHASSYVQTITVIDTTLPTITCPAPVTVECTSSTSPAALAALGPAPNWTIQGDGSVVPTGDNANPWAIELQSTSDGPNFYSAAIWTAPSLMTFSQLMTLSAMYNVSEGCFGGGSPRFQVALDDDNDNVSDGNVFVYWGTGPNFVDCPPLNTWQSTGNLITDGAARFDSTQFGGAFYGTHATTNALVGSYRVLRVVIAVDASWVNDQVMLVDNVQINATNHNFNHFGFADATDNCDGMPTITHSDVFTGSCGLTGTIQRTWTATDNCSNSISCVQTITVVDTTPPVITCPPAITRYCGELTDPPATGMASATDACSTPVVITWNDDRSGLTGCNATGTIVRTWTATDACGNFISCPQMVTLVDNTPPVLTACPGNITVNADAGGCSAVVTYTCPTAIDECYFEGFEDPQFQAGAAVNQPSVNWNQFSSQVNRVSSGTDGVPSSSGGSHGVVDSTGLPQNQRGAYTRLRGYSSVFGNGFTASVDVYMNLADPAVLSATPTTGYGWDLSTAANTPAGAHRRDFIFHTAAYSPASIVVAGSNNTGFARRNDLLSINHYEVTSSGWYTFEWVFRNNGGVLAVDLNLRNAGGTLLWTETRSDPSDVIPGVVGGNRYMWFTFLGVDRLPIDDTRLQRNIPVVCTPPSGSTFPSGDTTLTITATDACTNVASCTQTVHVNSVNDANVTVELQGVMNDALPLTRCIRFLSNCGATVDVPMSFVDHDSLPATPLRATATIEIPCGSYTSICAKDEQHTLQASSPLMISGTDYNATSVMTLRAGDTDNDRDVDINDVTWLLFQFGMPLPPDSCPWDGARNADFSNNGAVAAEDYTMLTANWLQSTACVCALSGPETPRRTKISVAELPIEVAAAADLNVDGFVDYKDVEAFELGNGLPSTLSTAMLLTEFSANPPRDPQGVDDISVGGKEAEPDMPDAKPRK